VNNTCLTSRLAGGSEHVRLGSIPLLVGRIEIGAIAAWASQA
jgi:hypothetical protein